MSHDNKQQGFTLIELLLAMAFISVLLLAIAMTVLQISTIYNRGIIVKEVNQVGRAVSTELQKAIVTVAPFSINQTPGSHYFQQGSPSVYGGRLCLGQYSYIWNYGSVLQPGTSPIRNRYVAESLLITEQSSPIRFIKVYDSNGSYCTNLNKQIDPTSATEILSIGDHSLVIQKLSVSTTTTAQDAKTGQQLYTIAFSLGTNDQGALTSGGTACKAPGVAGADLSYCVVQQFSIVVRAGNVVQ